MNYLPNTVKKYLEKRSFPKWDLNENVNHYFNQIVVVPAIAEFENIPKLINSLAQNDEESKKNTLLIFVINNSVESDNEIKLNNEKSIEYLEKIKFNKNGHGLNITFVDASSEGNELPVKDAGVGLARKVGLDTALKYFDYHNKKKNVLVCLDADCTVDTNYLSEIYKDFANHNLEAAVINFNHPLENEAIICYEIFLRYYVLALNWAQSQYAIHTVGSSIALTPEIYCKIGGMNKKKAGEDFYFLEKLAKVTNVGYVKFTTVKPSPRKSWRVPFGTGQRITRFYEEDVEEYLLYDPQIFVILKKWFNHFYNENISAANLITEAENISKELKEFLINNDFENALNKIIDNSKTVEQLKKQKKYWFDGFRTMKLIHYLRDKKFKNIYMFDALNEMFTLSGIESYPNWLSKELPPLDIQKKYLQILRQYT